MANRQFFTLSSILPSSFRAFSTFALRNEKTKPIVTHFGYAGNWFKKPVSGIFFKSYAVHPENAAVNRGWAFKPFPIYT